MILSSNEDSIRYIDAPKDMEELLNKGMNICDKCGAVEKSMDLNWIDQEDYWDDPIAVKLVQAGYIALCDACWKKESYKKEV